MSKPAAPHEIDARNVRYSGFRQTFNGAKRYIATAVCSAALLFAAGDATAQTVNLGGADNFAILAGSGITNTGATTINGDVGTFPTTSITGFETVTLNGVNNAGNSVTQQGKIDLVTAYNDAAGRAPTTVFAPASDLGGLTLVPGVYNNPSSFGITGTVTLDALGNPDAVWIFQTGSTLGAANNSNVSLLKVRTPVESSGRSVAPQPSERVATSLGVFWL